LDIAFPPKLQGLFSGKRFIICYGGRASGKSTSIARYLILRALQAPERILCTRETQVSMKSSVHQLLSDHISDMNLDDFFTVKNAEIICNVTQSKFIFAGLQDQGENLKSSEGITIVWGEESSQIKKTSYMNLLPTIRAANSQLIFSLNPKNKDDFIYSEFIDGKEDNPSDHVALCKINYYDNPFLPPTLLPDIERLKENDPDLYRHIYCGEILERSESLILKDKLVIDELIPKNNWQQSRGLDFGHNDPNALIQVWRTPCKNHLYISNEVYGNRIDNDQLYDWLCKGDPYAKNHTIFADSSRPEQIAMLRKAGMTKIQSCYKANDGLMAGINFLRSHKTITVNPKCTNTIEEIKKYSWSIEKRTERITDVPVDKFNHCNDAVRYACQPWLPRRSDIPSITTTGNTQTQASNSQRFLQSALSRG